MIVELAGLKVCRDHTARRDRSALGNLVIAHRTHTRLRADREDTVRRQSITQRAQTVAVKTGYCPAAIKRRDAGRPIPWLHHGVAIVVKRAVHRWHHRLALRPGFGDQHRLGHRRRAARFAEHFPDSIQRAGVRRAIRDDRFDVIDIVAVSLGDHPDLVALHPVLVAAQRVDLAIVRDHPEGLGERPLREGIGRIALVIDRKSRNEPLIPQIEIEIVDIGREEHALVDEGLVVQRADIKGRDARLTRAPLDAAAADVELALQFLGAAAPRIAEHDLFDCGARVLGLLADHGDIHRRLAPAIDIKARAQNFALHQCAAGFLRCEIRTRKEDLADTDPVVGRVVAGAAHMFTEKLLWHIEPDSRAIAGLAIGVHGAPVPDVFQRRDTHRDDLALRLAVERDDEADAAGILLVFRIIGVAVDQFLAIGFVLFHIVRHLTYSAATLSDAMAFIALCIASAASRPSLIAQTTRDAPRTISPAA